MRGTCVRVVQRSTCNGQLCTMMSSSTKCRLVSLGPLRVTVIPTTLVSVRRDVTRRSEAKGGAIVVPANCGTLCDYRLRAASLVKGALSPLEAIVSSFRHPQLLAITAREADKACVSGCATVLAKRSVWHAPLSPTLTSPEIVSYTSHDHTHSRPCTSWTPWLHAHKGPCTL